MSRAPSAVLLCTVTATAACATVLGIDEFTDAVGGGGPTSTGTPTATGGAGGTTATGTGSGAGGQAGAASWQHDWSRSFPCDLDASAMSVAVTPSPSHRIVIGGDFFGSIDFGGGAITSEETNFEDGYVAVFDADGSHRWTRRLGSYAYEHVESVAVDPSSDVWIAGGFQNHFEVHGPGGEHWDRGQNQGEAFVVKLDAQGECRFAAPYGNDYASQAALGVATDTQGHPYITGRFRGIVNFGQDDLDATDTDVFLLELDSGGAWVSDRQLGLNDDQHGYDVAVDAQNLPIVVGAFQGELTGGVTTAGGWDVFVVKYDAAGELAFVTVAGDGEDEQANAVATHGEDIVVVGQYRSQLDFGGDTLTTAGSKDAFIVRLDGAGGHVWSLSFGGPGDDVAHDVAVTADGLIVVTGEIADRVNFADCVLEPNAVDVFVLVLDAAGNPVWCERFGDADEQVGRAVAVDSTGAIILHGNVSGSINFGGDDLIATGATQDVFVARFARQ